MAQTAAGTARSVLAGGPGGRGRVVGNRVLALLLRPQGSPEGWGVLLSGVQLPKTDRVREGEAARKQRAPSRASPAEVLKGQLPARGLASRRKGSEADQTGKRWGTPSVPLPAEA